MIEQKRMRTKLKYLVRRIRSEQEAVKRYSLGILSENERRMGCNAARIAEFCKLCLQLQLTEYEKLTGRKFDSKMI